jgi:type I restriction enzyme M protein
MPIKKSELDSQCRKSCNDLIYRKSSFSASINNLNAELDVKLLQKYPTLSVDEIKYIMVDDKWMATLEKSIRTETKSINLKLAGRIKELAERYKTPLSQMNAAVAALKTKVSAHLYKMGFNMNSTR